MGKIKGIKITLIDKVKVGVDGFNSPIYEDKEIEVEDVLVGQPASDDVVNDLNLYGKRTEYILGIPKGDTHEWEDREVIIFGKRYRTFGHIIEGIEDLVPLRWHKKIRVERYG